MLLKENRYTMAIHQNIYVIHIKDTILIIRSLGHIYKIYVPLSPTQPFNLLE